MKILNRLAAFFAGVAFMLGVFAFAGAAEALPKEKLAAFIVIDRCGEVSQEAAGSWRQVVKWAYHFPYYRLLDAEAGTQEVALMLKKPVKNEAEALAKAAAKCGADVVVVARINTLTEKIVNSGLFDDGDTDVFIEISADLMVYKKEGAKLLKQPLRKRGRYESGNYEAPEETVKWELSKLVNTMENRPIIR